jgi:transcriptional regulator NrdR family protein
MTKAKVSTVSKIRKRDGTVVAFDAQKIEDAINKALVATSTGSKKLERVKELASKSASLTSFATIKSTLG